MAGSDRSRQHNKNNNHKSPRAVKFSPRLCPPPKNLPYYWSGSPYAKSGISIYDYHNGKQGNCTAYAWGRFWEISAHFRGILKNKLNSAGNAEDWYYGTNSHFNRGSTPQLGAVMCFAGGPYSGKGHVMVVEKIISPTHIVCSESAYKGYLFNTCDVYKKNGKWTHSSYKFQ